MAPFSCRRPTSLQDRTRDSDDEDFRDRDYDVAALASNLSQAFRYGIYSNDDIEEVKLKFFNYLVVVCPFCFHIRGFLDEISGGSVLLECYKSLGHGVCGSCISS